VSDQLRLEEVLTERDLASRAACRRGRAIVFNSIIVFEHLPFHVAMSQNAFNCIDGVHFF